MAVQQGAGERRRTRSLDERRGSSRRLLRPARLAGSFACPCWSTSRNSRSPGMWVSSQAFWAVKKAWPSIVNRPSASPFANRSSCQTMPKAVSSSGPNFAFLAKNLRFSSACAICHQSVRSPFFGLRFFHATACSSRGDDAMVRSSRSWACRPRRSARGWAGWTLAKSLSFLTCRTGTRARSRSLGPVRRGQAFDHPPEVDRRHRRADGVLAQRRVPSASSGSRTSGRRSPENRARSRLELVGRHN